MRTKTIIDGELLETSKKLSLVQDEVIAKQKAFDELKSSNLENIERTIGLLRKPPSLKAQSDLVLQAQLNLQQFQALEVKLQEQITALQQELKLFDAYDGLKSYQIKVDRHQTAIEGIADALKVISNMCSAIKQQAAIVRNRPDLLKILQPLRTLLPDYQTFMEHRAANISSHTDWMELQGSARGYTVNLKSFADSGTVEPADDAINAAFIREQANLFDTKAALPTININELIHQLRNLENILHCRIIVEQVVEDANNLMEQPTYRPSKIVQPVGIA